MDKMQRILSFAIRLEKQGQNFYTYYKEQVTNPSTKKIFEQLAEMEDGHHQMLQDKYDEIYGSSELKVISWVVDTNKYIKHPSIFGNQAQQLPEAEGDDDMSDLAVIRMAYSIESDFVEFYSAAEKEVDDEGAKKLLDTLKQWEEGHKRFFHDRYQQMMKRSWSDMNAFFFPES
ncbi:ferritin family protein [Mahella sp.]|uniref:ferritin-like domain-containing protein n=1 Tax=Mahella sp. TaxID=2798721 RepID=UPI0025C3071D|nr:ferritin family protein [Mahella sp.]MBZ4665885.1 Rubrerythrin [Mahella sp.]MDK2902419.1 hypothetical protein [Clostridiales bacterium]